MSSSNSICRRWLWLRGFFFLWVAWLSIKTLAAPATFRRIEGEIADIASDGSILTTTHLIFPDGSTSAEFDAFGDATVALAISNDGLTTAGHASTPLNNFYQGWIRREGGSYLAIGNLGGDRSSVAGMSDDGKYIAGTSTNASGDYLAFRWSNALGMLPIPRLNDSRFMMSSGISADGSVVVGSATVVCPECDPGIVAIDCAGDCGPIVATYSESFVWTASGGTRSLGALRDPPPPTDPSGRPNVPQSTYAHSISDDGSTVVGYTAGYGPFEGFFWRADTGMQSIPNLGQFNSMFYPLDVSGDGAVVVGGIGGSCGINCFSGPGATVWDAVHGTRLLKTVLEEKYGLGAQIGSGFLEHASYISADARTIAGYFDRTNGGGSWLVTLPTPINSNGLAGDYNNDGRVDASDYSVWRDRAATGAALPNDDTAGIGTDDFVRWRANYGRSLGGAGHAASAIVPEPYTVAQLASVVLFAALARRKRRGQVFLLTRSSPA